MGSPAKDTVKQQGQRDKWDRCAQKPGAMALQQLPLGKAPHRLVSRKQGDVQDRV